MNMATHHHCFTLRTPPLLYPPLSIDLEVSLDPWSPASNNHQGARLAPDWPSQVTENHPVVKGVKPNPDCSNLISFFSFSSRKNEFSWYEKLSPDVRTSTLVEVCAWIEPGGVSCAECCVKQESQNAQVIQLETLCAYWLSENMSCVSLRKTFCYGKYNGLFRVQLHRNEWTLLNSNCGTNRLYYLQEALLFPNLSARLRY